MFISPTNYNIYINQFSLTEYQKYLNFGNVERCMSSDIFEAAATATNSTCVTVWLRWRFLSDCDSLTINNYQEYSLS